MERKYFTEGSENEPEGKTVISAIFDDSNNFIAGRETIVTVNNKINEQPTGYVEYLSSLYKGAEITKEEFDIMIADTQNRVGFAGGMVNEVGKQALNDRLTQERAELKAHTMAALNEMISQMQSG